MGTEGRTPVSARCCRGFRRDTRCPQLRVRGQPGRRGAWRAARGPQAQLHPWLGASLPGSRCWIWCRPSPCTARLRRRPLQPPSCTSGHLHPVWTLEGTRPFSGARSPRGAVGGTDVCTATSVPGPSESGAWPSVGPGAAALGRGSVVLWSPGARWRHRAGTVGRTGDGPCASRRGCCFLHACPAGPWPGRASVHPGSPGTRAWAWLTPW